MDEPESKGAITIATRENWTTWSSSSTATCSVLDGPVTGNGKIINELEGIFVVLAGTLSRLSGAVVGMSCCVKTLAVS
ncbi:pyruvate dehydrogenase E1 component [Klebsiella pneumoniae]|uniref:Pyruvate dehydrogenase E1 component n=1 Tax=Klebsiella pneumoniae TaxID=573 RepID=A0A377XMS7_KLEPN|nr:pyruvate dehydrogenase E1 component [Klebsiella pneumoniae]